MWSVLKTGLEAASKITAKAAISIPPQATALTFLRCAAHWKIKKPPPGVNGKCFRRIVHYPEKYTVEPLNVTNLGGRDPVTGTTMISNQNPITYTPNQKIINTNIFPMN